MDERHVMWLVYLINRSVWATWPDKIPEVWTDKKVELLHLKIFGSPIMVCIPIQRRKKLERKSSEMILVGYDNNKKGYRCMNPNIKKLAVTSNFGFGRDL